MSLLALLPLLLLTGLVAGLDALARRRPARFETGVWRRVGDASMRTMAAVMPTRVLTPVQLVLQSHMPSWVFVLVGLLSAPFFMMAAPLHILLGESRALISSYDRVAQDDLDGIDAVHYEAMRVPGRTYATPSIPAEIVDADQPVVRLFLPHRPRLDNEDLAAVCPDLAPRERRGILRRRSRDRDEAWLERSRACLAKLWSVQLDGAPVALDLRYTRRIEPLVYGLTGYLAVSSLAAGQHELRVTRLDPRQTAQKERRPSRRRPYTYTIPFWVAR